MALTVETKFDPMVNATFLPHSLPDAGLVQQVDGPLLEHAGSQRRFDFSPTARFKYHRGDAGPVQQVRQQQASGASTDDANLRAFREGLRLNRFRFARPRILDQSRTSTPIALLPALFEFDCAAGVAP